MYWNYTAFSTNGHSRKFPNYALLHAPDYRAKFAENLKRELSRLPLDNLSGGSGTDVLFQSGAQEKTKDWKRTSVPLPNVEAWQQLVSIGRELGALHVGYESAAIYPLQNVNTTPDGVPYSARVGEKKMKWLDEGAALRVNSCIELRGFTPEMFDPRLGVRAALDWVIVCSRQRRRAFGSGFRSESRR